MFLCKWRARKQISLHRDNKIVLYCIVVSKQHYMTCCKERGCGAVRGKGRGEVSDRGEVRGSGMDGGGVAEGWS